MDDYKKFTIKGDEVAYWEWDEANQYLYFYDETDYFLDYASYPLENFKALTKKSNKEQWNELATVCGD